MKLINLFSITIILLTSSIIVAQVPSPVADNEMRDASSIRRRSVELERVKREANTLVLTEKSNGRVINFAEIKKDFENIQKLQTFIVKAYTTGKKIGYGEISKLSLEINKSSLRLISNLFPSSVVKKSEAKKEEPSETTTQKSVKEIIVDLDNNIGDFARSSMFQNLRVVDPTVSEKTRLNLEQIIKLSSALNQISDKKAKSVN